MSRRRLSSDEPRFDVDDMLCILRDNLGKADAFISAAEELIGRPGGGIESSDDADEDDVGRRRNHLAQLIESTKLAVRAAEYTSGEITAAQDKHRRGA